MKSFLYIIGFLWCSCSLAQNTAAFEKANTLYNQGDYNEAITQYKSILDAGEHSAALYFNLANAHYKLNHIAPSIYYYEKALLLKPNDKDILNNIAYARNMTIDDIETMPEVGFSRLLKSAADTLSFDNWAKFAVGMVLVFVLLFIAYYFSYRTTKKRVAFIVSAVCLLAAFVALSFAFYKYNLVAQDQPAIVFAQETQIKSEPNLRSTVSFTLHEGAKVQVLDTVSHWKKISIADGKTGWILEDDIKMLKTF